jgi:hypothetical protein
MNMNMVRMNRSLHTFFHNAMVHPSIHDFVHCCRAPEAVGSLVQVNIKLYSIQRIINLVTYFLMSNEINIIDEFTMKQQEKLENV